MAGTENNMQLLLWGKTNPYKALLCHMTDAGCCAKAYLESSANTSILHYLADQWNISHNEAVSFAAYLVSLHDIGKATPQFQMQDEEQLSRLKETEVRSILPDSRLNFVRHEFLSQRIAKRIWKERGEDRRLYDAYSCILSLHHQKMDESEKGRAKVQEEWKSIQGNLEESVSSLFHFSGHLPEPKCLDSVCILLTGIAILCDWVASSGPFDSLPYMTDGYYEDSLETAKAAMKHYGLTEDHRIPGIECFQAMWPAISEPRDIQKKTEILDANAPLTIIEAPMGEGKTEAAIFFAERAAEAADKRGIYIALPTQATSNQMFDRMNHMLESFHGVHARLMHGTAFLMKDAQEEIHSEDAPEAEKWLGSARMAMLDENGVGTVDQAMGAVLLARFSVLRLLGLTNKALIIDELHAYDAYMSRIIESLLRWCKVLNIPVILLSATLQDSQRKRYLSCYMEEGTLPELNRNYPLITQITKAHMVVQTEAKASMSMNYHFAPVRFGQDDRQTAEFAAEKVRHGGCYCVIVNTVNRAQRIYSELKQIHDPDLEIMLFHARFQMRKRNDIEKECILKFGKQAGNKRPGKAILVATQVVEQSLDIDFDGMISELAPIDLLLQRAGRVHRHRSRARPESLKKPVIHVIMPETEDTDELGDRYGASGLVYDPFLLCNTESLFCEEKTIQVPVDVRDVISQVYEQVSEKNMEAWIKRNFNAQLFSANADWAAFPSPAADCFFPTQFHPEFENLNIDDGFDPAARAATRLGDPTFRISFISEELLEKAKSGHLTKEQQKEVLFSSVSLRLNPDIEKGLASNGVFQIRKGPLWGCYLAEKNSIITVNNRRLINDPEIGIYWEEQKV